AALAAGRAVVVERAVGDRAAAAGDLGEQVQPALAALDPVAVEVAVGEGQLFAEEGDAAAVLGHVVGETAVREGGRRCVAHGAAVGEDAAALAVGGVGADGAAKDGDAGGVGPDAAAEVKGQVVGDDGVGEHQVDLRAVDAAAVRGAAVHVVALVAVAAGDAVL